MERIALQVGGTRRTYLLNTPAPHSDRPTLVVFLHGTGATADWADDETGWSRLADREGFVLAVPDGLPPDPTKPPKFLTNPPRWDDHGTAPDDIAFLAAVFDDAANRSGADPNRVCVSGFSNGAGMAFRVAAELADRVAAVAPVAGHCWLPEPHPARPVPTLYVIGSVDPLIPLRGGEVRSPWLHRYVRRPPVAETLEKWAHAIGCEPIPREAPSPTPLPAGEGLGRELVRVDIYPGPVPFHAVVIDGLGHHWPGGKGGFNHRIAGPPSDAVNGTELVWEFLKGARSASRRG